MAIRFQCPACSEPIEVDDEWARRVVRCPYCQRTVTASSESTLPTVDQIPTATPIAGRAEFQPSADPVTPSGAVPPYPPAPGTNRAALTAMILAGFTVIFWLLYLQTMSNHRLDIQEFNRFMEHARSSGTPTMTAVMKYYETKSGQVPGWMITLSFLTLGFVATWLGSIIFGIIGLFRPIRRAMAVTALITAGTLSGMCCLSAMSGVGG